MTLDEGDRLISSGLNTSIGGAAGDTSLDPLTEDGVLDARAQKGAAARAHKKKTAAQVYASPLHGIRIALATD